MSRRGGGRDLSGWTVTGGSSCSGREVPPLPDGRVDWSRPAREPDNRLRVRLGRAAAVFGPLLAALPLVWLGLAANQRLIRSGFPAWIASQDWPAVGHYALWATSLAAATALGGYLSQIVFARPPTPARVAVTVASSPYPVGQLMFRRLDSPALLPPGPPPPALGVECPGRVDFVYARTPATVRAYAEAAAPEPTKLCHGWTLHRFSGPHPKRQRTRPRGRHPGSVRPRGRPPGVAGDGAR